MVRNIFHKRGDSDRTTFLRKQKTTLTPRPFSCDRFQNKTPALRFVSRVLTANPAVVLYVCAASRFCQQVASESSRLRCCSLSSGRAAESKIKPQAAQTVPKHEPPCASEKHPQLTGITEEQAPPLVVVVVLLLVLGEPRAERSDEAIRRLCRRRNVTPPVRPAETRRGRGVLAQRHAG